MIKKLLISLCLLTITACGFRPLYSTKHENPTLESISLGQVKYQSYPTAIDHAFRSELDLVLDSVGSAEKKKYRLEVELAKSNLGLGTQQNTINTRTVVMLTATFTIFDNNTGKVLVTDSQKISDSFEVSVSPYSSLVSEEQTSIKLAKNLAHEIILRVDNEIIRLKKDGQN